MSFHRRRGIWPYFVAFLFVILCFFAYVLVAMLAPTATSIQNAIISTVQNIWNWIVTH